MSARLASENREKSRNELISGPTCSENGSKFPFSKFTFCPRQMVVDMHTTGAPPREQCRACIVAGVKVTDLSERGGSGGGMMVVGGSWTSVTSHLINWMLTRGATEEH